MNNEKRNNNKKTPNQATKETKSKPKSQPKTYNPQTAYLVWEELLRDRGTAG